MATIGWRGSTFGWKDKDFGTPYIHDSYGYRTSQVHGQDTPPVREQGPLFIDTKGNIIRHRRGQEFQNADYEFKPQTPYVDNDLDPNRIISQGVRAEGHDQKDWTERGGNWYLERFGTEEDLTDDNRGRGQEVPIERSTQVSFLENKGLAFADLSGNYPGWWKPRMDIFQEEERGTLRIEFELPGVAKDDIVLDVDADQLTIRTLKPMSLREQQGTYLHSERHFGNYYRKISFPYLVDPHTAKALLEHGVLKVTLRKSQSGGSKYDHVKVRQG